MAPAAMQIPLVIDYDAEADALHVSCGEACPSVGKLVDDGFIIRYPLNNSSNPMGVIVQRFKANGWANNRVKLAWAIADILPIEPAFSPERRQAGDDRMEHYLTALQLIRLWHFWDLAQCQRRD